MTTLELLRKYLQSYFVDHNFDQIFDLLTEDVHSYGLAENVEITSLAEARAMVSAGNYQQFMDYQLELGEGTEVSEASAVLQYTLTHNSVSIRYRLAGHSRMTASGNKLYFLNSSMVNPFQTLHMFEDIARERRANAARHILKDTIPGGIMGGYNEPHFPFYFINDNMLQYLGYENESDFVQKTCGMIENCIHPDDRETVNTVVAKQLAENGRYVTEYRMLKKDGSYIWVHDVGEKIQAENGREAIMSACYDVTSDKEHDRFLQGLVESLNGDLVLLAVDVNAKRTIPVYVSDNMGKQQGITKEEYLQKYDKNAMNSIYPGDRERVWSSMLDALDNDTAPCISMRIIDHNGKTKWMNASFTKHGEQDGLPVLLVLFTASTIQNELQLHALDQDGIGVALIDADTKEVYYVNSGMFQMLGLREIDFIGRKCPEVLHGCGGSCESCKLREAADKKEYDMTVFFNGKWLSFYTERKAWADKNVISVYSKDITTQQQLREKQKETNKQLQQQQELLNNMFSNMPGGVCLYRWDGAKLHPVSVSKHYSDFFGADGYELMQGAMGTDYSVVHPDDLKGLQKYIQYAANTPGEGHSYTYRVWNNVRKCYLWIIATANVVTQDGGNLVYVNYTDVTKEKENEQRLKQEQEIMQNACEFANLMTWVYDMPGDRMFPSPRLQHEFGMPQVVNDYPESWFAMGCVQPEYVELHRQKVLAVKNGSDREEFEIKVQHPDGVHWTRVIISRLRGNPNLAACSSQLIDDEMQLRARVELEKKRVLSSDSGLRGYVISNVTKDKVYDRDITRPDAHKAIIGLTIEQAIDNAMPDIMEADREKYRTVHNREMLLEAYRHGETSFEFIGHRVAKDGALYWIRCALNLVKDPATDDIILYESIYDIHGQMMANEIMHTTTKYMFERAASVNIKTNQMTLISHENADKLQDIIVWNYEESSADYCRNTVLEEDRAAFAEAIRLQTVTKQLADKDEYSFVIRVKEADGLIGYRHTRFCYYNREMGLCLMTRVNVTKMVLEEERRTKQLAEALKQARETLSEKKALEQDREVLYAALFNIVPMVIYNNITQNYYNMLNYDSFTTKKAAYSGTYDELIAVGTSTVPDDQKEAFSNTFGRENILRAYECGEKYVILVHQQYGDDGVLRWIETRSIPVKDPKTGDLHTITLSQDVTEQKESEVRLHKALETAESATHAKSEFLSRMSHEIRTPMNAIMGMTAIAKENRADFRQVAECLDKIDMSSHFLLTLINDILEMSRIESGRTEIKHQEFSFDFLIESIRTVVEPLALKGDIRYDFVNNAKTDSHYIGDAMRIQQIVVNIVTNAIKFTKPGGRVRFAVEIDNETAKQTHFCFEIADTGIGMTEEFMHRMFQPFTQEDGSNTSQFGGSGLGLAISKSLVEAMSGTIEAESFPGIGTTFTIRLPIDRMSYDFTEKNDKTAKPVRAVTNFDVLRGCNILMAEDHPLNVMVARKILERKGVTVNVAENGKSAVETFAASVPGEYDAILMDIRMPVMDGWTATHAIRALDRPDAKAIPIIAMTANALEEDRNHSREVGMNEHLAKPFDPVQLYSVLSIQIENRKAKGGNSK